MNIFYNKQVDNGKKISIAIILITNIYLIVKTIYNLYKGIGGTFIYQIILVSLMITTSFLFYKGSWVARHIIGGIFGIVAWINTFYILDIVGLLGAYDGLLMLILTIIIPIFVMILVSTNKNISKFIEYQRSINIEGKNITIAYVIFFGIIYFNSYFAKDVFGGILLTIPFIYYTVKFLRAYI